MILTELQIFSYFTYSKYAKYENDVLLRKITNIKHIVL